MQSKKVSYQMLFCALLLARSDKITLTTSLNAAVPLSGGAQLLARQLALAGTS